MATEITVIPSLSFAKHHKDWRKSSQCNNDSREKQKQISIASPNLVANVGRSIPSQQLSNDGGVPILSGDVQWGGATLRKKIEHIRKPCHAWITTSSGIAHTRALLNFIHLLQIFHPADEASPVLLSN